MHFGRQSRKGVGWRSAQGRQPEAGTAHLVTRSLDHERGALSLACNGAHSQSRTGGGKSEHEEIVAKCGILTSRLTQGLL